MNAPLDALALHAQNNAGGVAVVVDESGGGAPVDHHLRRAQRAREPARARAARRGRAAGRAAGVVRPQLARGARHHPRRPQAATSSRCRCRTASTPTRWQYVIDNSDATIVVVDAEQAPLVADGPRPRSRRCARSSCSAAPHRPGSGFLAWDDVRRGPARRRTATIEPAQRGRRGDDLHVGHDRQAEGRAAHAHRPAASCSRCSAS